MHRLAIVAALEREVGPLVKKWQVREAEHAGRNLRFFEKGNVVVVCGGIGAESARRAAEAVIALYGPTLICSAGFAGATHADTRVGDIVIPRRVVDVRDGSSVDTGIGEGVLVSYEAVASPQQKAKLGEAFNAQAVDMEAAAVAKAASARGIRFAAVKGISDEIDFELPSGDRFFAADGSFRTGSFALFALARPWIWGKVLKLQRNSAHAANTLSERLRTMTCSADAVLQWEQKPDHAGTEAKAVPRASS